MRYSHIRWCFPFQSVGLKKTIRELEQKIQDQEEELDEQAGEIQVLEQGKLRLEMATERDKLRVQKELETKDEEVEEIRQVMQKKVQYKAILLYCHVLVILERYINYNHSRLEAFA